MALALAPAQKPAAVLHLDGEADAVVGQDHVLLGQLGEGHVQGLRFDAAALAHLHGDLEAVLGRGVLGISLHVSDLDDGVPIGFGKQILVQLLGQGRGGVPRHGDHQVRGVRAGDVEGVELIGVGRVVFAARLDHGAAVAGTVHGLHRLAVQHQRLVRYLRGAGDGLFCRGVEAVVDLIGGGVVHVVGLAAADADLRQSVPLGGDHGGFQKRLGGVPAHLGHGHAQHVVLHAHGVHGSDRPVGHVEGDAAPVGALLPAGGGQGEEVGPILGGQGDPLAGEQGSQLVMGHHHLRAGHGHGQGAAGDLGAFQGVGAGQGQRQHVSALRGQAHPHVAFLRPNGGGDGYEPRQQDEGDEDAEFLFHSSVYTIRRRKREYRWEFVDDSFAICPNIRVPQA